MAYFVALMAYIGKEASRIGDTPVTSRGGPSLLSGIGRRLGTDEHDPVGAQHLHRQQASARLFLTALGVGPKREAAHRLSVYCTWIATLVIAQRARAAVRERP
jgi:hypothetical protein